MTDPDTRRIAFDALTEILEDGRFSHIVMDAVQKKYQYLSKQDRAFMRRLVMGTVEYRIRIDHILDRYSKTPVRKMKPRIRTILRMSVYQIMHMDRVPDSAACNEAVKMTRGMGLSGLSGYVNGVLRTIAREKDRMELLTDEERYSQPAWLASLWRKELGDDAACRMMQAFLEPVPFTVRFRSGGISDKMILDSLAKQGITARKLPGEGLYSLAGVDYPEAVNAFREGHISIQDFSSSLSGDAAGIRPGDLVLDVCAAPGGKAIHAAELLGGSGLVIARDVNPARTELIRESIERTGLTNIRAEVRDALDFDESLRQKADVVIADLPCSGLGVIGRKPDIKHRIKPEDLVSLRELQRRIFDTVWQYVKPGGTLVYSTCTVNRAENEENFRYFLGNYPFSPVDISGRLGGEIRSDTMADGYIQLLPGRDPCDGFFIGVMRRNESGE